MKHILVFLVAGVLGVFIGAWAANAWIVQGALNLSNDGRNVGPRISVLTTLCDLGTVRAKETLVARFAVRNDGGRRLVVTQDRGGCCGTTGQDSITIVDPGGSAELPASIDIADESGHFESGVTYLTNDPALPQFQVTVSATLQEGNR